jgi:Kef-type K+ transport system membrane component KefB
MRKVLVYSLLLLAGLIGSQWLPAASAATDGSTAVVRQAVQIATMVALAFIMIHVGYEFEIDRSRPGRYAWDATVAMTAAALPWLMCAVYFVFVMSPAEQWGTADLWRGALLRGLFAAPTSAGVLFSMLAAAGLGATWLFRKARVLAIFDDLGTVLLMVPLKAVIIGPHWQLASAVAAMAVMLWLTWRYLHMVRLPVSWPWVIGYAVAITGMCEGVYLASTVIDETVPVHIEVLLPAFALGCVLRRPPGADPHADDAREGVEEGPESPREQRVSTIVSAAFMVLVGLSMPPILPAGGGGGGGADPGGPGWGVILLHVLGITVLSNLGKLFPMICYRREATPRERLALSVGMFPRGEVGAGVLVVSLSYGLGGPMLTVAVLSLALNLVCTGLFVVVVKKLIAAPTATAAETGHVPQPAAGG